MRHTHSLRRPIGRRSQIGMTLIEIVVVIVLIGTVLAVVGTQIFGNRDKANFKLANVQVQKVGAVIENYQSDVGNYPRSLDDLLKNPGANGWIGPYAKESDLKDPWNKPLVYRAPGESGPFDLISQGKDGQPGGESVNADIAYKP